MEVSPIGLTRIDSAGQQQLCRWWPKTGDASLCRTPETEAATRALARLPWGYLLLQGGFWLGTIALFLVVLRTPRQRFVRAGAALLTAVSGLAGALCVFAAPTALEVLKDVPLSFTLSGALLAFVGTGAAALSGLLQLWRE